MSHPDLQTGVPLPDPTPLGRYFYTGSRHGVVFVAPHTEAMRPGVFGGLFKQGWRFATDQEIAESTHTPIPAYPVHEPEPRQPVQPEPEPQRQPAVAPTPRRTAVAEPETEPETTDDVAQEIA